MMQSRMDVNLDTAKLGELVRVNRQHILESAAT